MARTITATADSALAAVRPSLAACLRCALVFLASLALVCAGFAAARFLAEPAGAWPAAVCSETCGPLPTTTAPVSGRGEQKRWKRQGVTAAPRPR